MNEHETKTIRAFFLKEKQDRYLLLLSNPKRRIEALNRLNMDYRNTDFDPRYAQWLPSNVDIAALLRKEGCPMEVYVISGAAEIDGKTLALEEALEMVTHHGFGSIISCIPGKLAYYYNEEGAIRALLKRL